MIGSLGVPMLLEVLVRNAAGRQHAVRLDRRISIGRGPENDVVIKDSRVSWNHAMIWMENGAAMVTDLGSRNGTQLRGKQVVEPLSWNVGDVVNIAGLEFCLARASEMREPNTFPSLALEDVATGVRFPLRKPHVVVGETPDADLRIEGVQAARLISHANGEVWLGSDANDDRPLTLGETFTIGDAELRVVVDDDGWLATANDDDTTHPYAVEVAFDPDLGPWARIRCSRTSASHVVSAGNRVSLLYCLAEAVCQDGERGMVLDERGWRSNETVSVAVWGRAGREGDPGKLKTLIYNIRTELKDAGLDPWCIEKRRGFLRLRVREARLAT